MGVSRKDEHIPSAALGTAIEVSGESCTREATFLFLQPASRVERM